MKPKPIIFKYVVALIIQCWSSVLISPVFAQAVLFDFDNAPLHSSLPISQTVNGITALFTATGQGYSIQDANVLGFTPQGFSGRVIYPNSVFLADLQIKFDSTLTDFSIMYSCQELGCDDAATMRVTAYMNGNFIGTKTKTASNPGTWPVDILSCSFLQGFDSVVVHYDSHPPTCQDYGVIFMADNMRVTTYTVVPVNLLYFNCENKGNAAVLQWKSANEINLNSYIVQCSKDGIDFRDLARINAEGANHNYSFIHQNVNNTVYYRLKMLDQDGVYNYSEIKKLIFKPKADFTIVSNPSNDYIHINCDNPIDLKTIQILSIGGVSLKIIRDYTCGQKIIVSDLSKGVYILKAYSLKNELLFEKFFLKM
jgi:hypothetical protein